MGSEPAGFAVKWPVTVEGQPFADLEALRRAPVSAAVLHHLVQLADPTQPGFVVRSSGSTGEPKEFVVPKEKAWISAYATGDALGLRPGMRVLLALDPHPIGGRMVLVRALALGLDLLVCEPATVPSRPASGETCDLVSLVPRQLAALASEVPDRLARMGRVLVGGGPLHGLRADVPVPVWHTFGMTETVSHVALRRVGEATFRATGDAWFEEREGRLVIHAPQAVADPLVTNDLVRLVSPTEFEWLGRADFAIISGGRKVLPEALEQELAGSLPGREFAVVGVPSEEWGQDLVLVIEGEAVAPPAVASAVPIRRVVSVAALPRLASGKVDRRALASMVVFCEPEPYP